MSDICRTIRYVAYLYFFGFFAYNFSLWFLLLMPFLQINSKPKIEKPYEEKLDSENYYNRT